MHSTRPKACSSHERFITQEAAGRAKTATRLLLRRISRAIPCKDFAGLSIGFFVADRVPRFFEQEGMKGIANSEPRDEVAWRVGIVAGIEILGNERQCLPLENVKRWGRVMRPWRGGLLHKGEHPTALIHLDHSCLAQFSEVVFAMRRDAIGLAFREETDEAWKREQKNVVRGDDKEIVRDTVLPDCEPQV